MCGKIISTVLTGLAAVCKKMIKSDSLSHVTWLTSVYASGLTSAKDVHFPEVSKFNSVLYANRKEKENNSEKVKVKPENC